MKGGTKGVSRKDKKSFSPKRYYPYTPEGYWVLYITPIPRKDFTPIPRRGTRLYPYTPIPRRGTRLYPYTPIPRRGTGYWVLGMARSLKREHNRLSIVPRENIRHLAVYITPFHCTIECTFRPRVLDDIPA